MKPPSRSPALLALAPLLATLALTTASAAPATQVKIFQTQSAVGFLGGKLNGISVDALGRMRLADSLQRVTASGAIAEPFVFAAAALPVAAPASGTAGDRKSTRLNSSHRP